MIKASTDALAGLAAYRKAERECYNASDLDLVKNFAEDFILISNGVPTLEGREAVRDFFREVWKQFDARFIEVNDDHIVESGDHLFVNGRFVLELTPKDGGDKIIDRGRFQGVLVKGADGKYRLWREACTDSGAEEA